MNGSGRSNRNAGARFRRPMIDVLEDRRLLASDWQNPFYAFDAVDDGIITPKDALTIIDALNTHGAAAIVSPFLPADPLAAYLDTNGNGILAPIDAMLIINLLNSAPPSLSVTLHLANDTGDSATDGLTSDPSIVGHVALMGMPLTSVKAWINRDAVLSVPVDASGNFTIQPPPNEIGDGPNRIMVVATDASGFVGLKSIQFTLDATAPTIDSLTLVSDDDTGASNVDGITKITTPRLMITAEAGSPLHVTQGANVLFDGLAGDAMVLPLGTLSDGDYPVTATARDAAGNVSEADLIVTVDTVPPPAATLDLAITSDTGPKSDQQTGATRVTLVGTTEPGSYVTVDGVADAARSMGGGKFRLPNVVLASGPNIFKAHVVDLAGNAGPDSQTTITRIVEAGVTDPVVRWDAAALEAIRLDATDPPVASRTLAMMSLAMYDIVNAVEGTPSFAVSLPTPIGMSPEAAASAAADAVLSYAYPGQQAMLEGVLNAALAEIPDGQAKTDGVTFGQLVGQAIIALRDGDGSHEFVDYTPSETVGSWVTTAPMFAPALLPQWGGVTPFAIASTDALLPAGPPDLTSAEYATAVNEIQSLGAAAGSSRTADQTQIARFWGDGAGTYTPPGHWNAIASRVAQSAGNSFGENARLFAELNAALGDAGIVAWDAKFTDQFWRPITAIQQANLDGNDQTTADPNWQPLLVTPPFPEYISGHSTFSAAAATVLDDEFGSVVSFSTTSLGLPGVQRTFTSFDQAAQEAGRSRVYGGIHYEFSNQDGQATGRAVGQEVLARFSAADDLLPPKVIVTSPAADSVTSKNPTIHGWALDNLSGVASLKVSVDGGSYSPLNFDASGQFSLTPTLPLDGSADGTHMIHFRATDYARLNSPTIDFSFTLDTKLPAIDVTSPTAVITGGDAFLEGSADGTGSSIVSLSYTIDAGVRFPVVLDSDTGDFSQAIDLSRVAAGNHTLTIVAQDAAGLITSKAISFQLATAIPLTITDNLPTAGALDVGSTFHPQIVFSRPVKASSLTAANFFATDAGGRTLPTKIVPSGDGSFVWLFFNSPMPGGSTIAVHVVGDSILAAADNQPLDADGDGQPGGTLTYQFSTVSLTPLPGTSLSGKVVDPGDDLKPMTFDDMRAGPDGVLHTADDLFLHPIAGVTVSVLGASLTTLTDDQGNFHFDSVPAGDIKLAIDGRTATNAPAGFYFPEMVMDLSLQPGQANTVMGTMGSPDEQAANRDRQEAYLPRLQTSLLHDVSNTQPTLIGVDGASAPNLRPEQQALLKIDVQPGSLIDASGNPLVAGQVGISTVPPEMVRDMLPPGVLEHTFDITIQAPGITNFSTPAPMTFPNVFNSPPGSQLNFLSFDHTTGRLVIEGTATVSADGLSVTTDPGTGVTHPGWHGLTPPGGPGGGGGGPGGNGPPNDPLVCQIPPDLAGGEGEAALCPVHLHDPIALPLIAQEKNGKMSDDTLPEKLLTWKAPPTGKLFINIGIDGPLKTFMKQTGNVALSPSSFALTPGMPTKKLTATTRTYQEILGKGSSFAEIEGDRLYGARITVTTILTGPGVSTSIDIYTFYQYRWISATYAPDAQVKPGNPNVREGTTAAFLKTLVDGPGDVVSTKNVRTFLPSSVTTSFELVSGVAAALPPGTFSFGPGIKGSVGGDTSTWTFDPRQAQIYGVAVNIKVNEDNLNVGNIIAQGRGILPTNIGVDGAGYTVELKRVIESLQYVWFPGPDNKPGRAGVDDDHDGKIDDLSEYGWSPSDDVQKVAYRYSAANPSAKNPFPEMSLSGPAPPGSTRKYFVFDPTKGTDTIPGKPKFSTYVIVGDSFQAEFTGFMPYQKEDFGPDATPGTTDDEFTPPQAAALDQTLALKQSEIVIAVEADYLPVDNGTGAFRISDGSAGDIKIHWADAFTAAGGALLSGTAVRGSPLFGFAHFDADYKTDDNSDGVVLKAVIADKAIPVVAKAWAMAEELNDDAAEDSTFGLGINLKKTSPISFAQFVVNSVSHELAHTFGINDAYVNVYAGPGTSGCRPDGNCLPFDIMMNGHDSDPDLSFVASNVALLRGAMGISNETELTSALNVLKRTFNLASSAVGIRENSEPVDDYGLPIEPPPAPNIVVSAGDDYWVGDSDDPTLDTGEAAADGAGGDLRTATITISNIGTSKLDISALKLLGSDTSFAVVDGGLAGSFVDAGTTRQISVRFDPLLIGPHDAKLEIDSGDPYTPVLTVPLTGTSFNAAPTIHAELIHSNNLGSAQIGSSPAVTSEIFKLTNFGKQPLTIDSIVLPEGNGAFRLLGVPDNLSLQPITLARGETFTFGARFDAQKPGLARALIDVHSKDPAQPKLRLAVVGTGSNGTTQVAWGNDYVALATPDQPLAPQIRTKSNDTGRFDMFLPPDQLYDLTIFDPQTGLIGEESGTTAPSGNFTPLADSMVFGASTTQDTDYDGLPDDIEQTIGTSINRTDSDGNGLDDFAEIMNGLDPLGGRPVATGIVAQLPLTGEAKHVVVATANGPDQPALAYLATGSGGLAIVDVSNFTKPLLLSELDLPGDATDVAVDSVRGLVAVATGATGLVVIDVSTPTAPKVLRTINVNTTQVEESNGIAYVADGSNVDSFDITDGSPLDQIYMGSAIGGLARDGQFLYATQSGSIFSVLDIGGNISTGPTVFDKGGVFLTRRGQVQLPIDIDPVTEAGNLYNGSLFVGGGVAYVMNTQARGGPESGGFATVDVSDPDLPKLISSVDRAAAPQPEAAVAANGSGLALLAGAPLSNGPGTNRPRVDLVDVSDPRNTYQLLRSINLPSIPFDVITAAGAGFVADGVGGLAVINYLPFDVDGQAPKITIAPGNAVQSYFEGDTVRLSFTVQDDVQTRGMELLYSSDPFATLPGHENSFTVLRSDVSFPFDDLEFPAPRLAPGSLGGFGYVKLRATDTGGNSATSEGVLINVHNDIVPPVYFPRSFVDNSVRAVGLSDMSLFFSEPLNRLKINTQTVRVVDAQNNLVPGLTVSTTAGDTVIKVNFNPLAVGNYRLIIDGTNVTDRGGIPLGSADVVTNFQIVNATPNNFIGGFPDGVLSASWNDPKNWSAGRVPGASDLVTIVIPDDKTVDYSGGPADAIFSLTEVGGTLQIFGGSLAVNLPSQVDQLSLRGGRLEGSGDLTINKSLLLSGGVLAGAGQTIIPVGATAEFHGGGYEARPLFVSGQMKVTGGVGIARSPVVEIRTGATLELADGSILLNNQDNLPWQINVFGQVITDSKSSVIVSGEMNIMPGGVFNPNASQMELLGGGHFNEPLSIDAGSVLYLRGPYDGFQPAPRYVLPSGLTHQIDGSLIVGGAEVVVGGDANVRDLDFADDGFGTVSRRTGTLTIDGTLTITQQMAGHQPQDFGYSPLDMHFSGGRVQGKGELLIQPQAIYHPTSQVFHDVTIRSQGTLDLTGILSLGSGADFELEGPVTNLTMSDGTAIYGVITEGSSPATTSEPLDVGTFNARVPLTISGQLQISAIFNEYAGLTLHNPAPPPFNQSRFLRLREGGNLIAPVIVEAGMDLQLHDIGLTPLDPRNVQNVYTVAPTGGISGDGMVELIQSSLALNAPLDIGTLYFYGNDNAFQTRNVVRASAPISVRTSMQWKSGLEIDGPRTVTINPTADFQIIGISSGGYFPRLAFATLINKGASSSLTDPMEMAGGALLRNEGTFSLGGQAKIHQVGTGGSILNVGTLTTDPAFSAPWTIESPIDNRGIFDLKSFTSNDPNNPFVVNSVDNSGTIIVEPNHIHSGTLTYGGDISIGSLIERSGSVLTIQVSRDEPKFGGNVYWGGLKVTGTAQLAGTLNIDYVVQNVLSAAKAIAGDAYRPLDTATRVGDFSTFGDLDPGDGIGYSRSFDASGMVVAAISDPQALRAASLPISPLPAANLSSRDLARITDAAIADWAAAGVAAINLDRLRSAKISIADLPGNLLGLTSGDSITIDRDAAGWGWFIDQTPSADEEFAFNRAPASSPAHKHVDLLTAVLHEMGHFLGLAHSDDASDVMSESLDPSQRKRRG